MRPSLRASLSGLCLLTLLALNTPLGATTLTVTDGDESASLISQGWSETSPGIWERFNLEGQQETFVSSAEGLRSILPSLQEQAKQRFETYLANPTAENQRAYEEHKALVDSVVANLQAPAPKKRLQARGAAAAAPLCTRTYGYNVFLSGTHCLDAVDSSASYSTSNATACPELCTVHSYSYSTQVNCSGGQTATQNDSCSLTGTNVSCYSYADNFFGKNCYRYGFASVHCPALNNLFLSQSGTQSTCRCTC